MVFSLYSETEVINKHCPIRWLSFVEHYISQLERMKSYFRSCDEENVKVRSILTRLEDPLLEPFYVFHAFNESVQLSVSKSDENRACEVYTEIEQACEVVCCCKSSIGRSHCFCRTV